MKFSSVLNIQTAFKLIPAMVAAAVLAIGTQAAAAERAELHFEKQIEVSVKAEYHLSDFVEVKAGSAGLVTDLENQLVEINTSKDFYLTAAEVRAWILALQANSETYRNENPKLMIPANVAVKFSRGASSAHVARLIRNHLRTQCEACQIQVASISGLDRLRGTNWSLNLSNVNLASSVMIPMQTSADSATTVAQFISAQIKQSKMVWVANKQIPYNTRIAPEDLEQRMTDVTFAKEAPVAKEQIQGALTTRSLGVGAAIFPADLKREQAIKKAQLVRAIAGDSDLEVTTSAMAEEGGFIGDLIKIKTLDGNKILSGVIVEKGSVRLQ